MMTWTISSNDSGGWQVRNNETGQIVVPNTTREQAVRIILALAANKPKREESMAGGG